MKLSDREHKTLLDVRKGCVSRRHYSFCFKVKGAHKGTILALLHKHLIADSDAVSDDLFVTMRLTPAGESVPLTIGESE